LRVINQSDKSTLRQILIYYAALVFNIFLGWIIAKLNTEYLSLADYGRYSFFVIFIFFSRAFFGFGVFESTSRLLTLTQSKNESEQLAGTSILWTLLFFIPLTLILFIFSFFSDRIFEVKISNLLLIFAPFTGLILLQSHFNLMLRGWGRVNLMAFVTVLPRIIYIILLGYIIFINSFTLQSSLSMWFLGFFLAISLCIFCIRPKFTSIKDTSKKIYEEVKTYGIHLYISQIWHEIFFHTDKFVISYFLSAESMAYYALGYMITFPLTHFSTALSSTLFKKFSAQEKINPKVHIVNGIFVVTSVIIFILLRKYIIIYLFSDNYLPTIELIIPLALAFGFSGLSKPFSLYLMARKHGKTVRNISITIPVLHIAVGLYIIPKYGIYGAAWVATGVYLVDMLLFMISYFKIISGQKNHP
jgi:polysaccharide transporter, PST family